MNTLTSTPTFTDRQFHQLHQILDAVSLRIVASYMLDPDKISDKSDGTPLSATDIASSKFLVSALPSVLDVQVISEENYSGNENIETIETFWLIDPIDGTKGFLKRNGQFCVCVALVHQNRAILGAIYEPLTQTCWMATHSYSGEATHALKKWVNGHLITVATPVFEEPFVLATGSGKNKNYVDYYREQLACLNFQHITKGSALKFADIVEGYCDLYVKLNTTSAWDTAAGQVLVEVIGGCVLDISGKPLRYGHEKTMLNPDFIACSPTMTNDQINKAVKLLVSHSR